MTTRPNPTQSERSWGYMAVGPVTDHPCDHAPARSHDCGRTPTRALLYTRGWYCERHCRAFARFWTAVAWTLTLAVPVGLPVLFIGVALGWWG